MRCCTNLQTWNQFHVCILLALIVLSGCSKVDYTLKWNDALIVDYASGDTPLHLIEYVGDVKVEDSMIVGNTLEVGNFIIWYDIEWDDKKLGNHIVSFETNSVDLKYITLEVRVADLSAPALELEMEELELTIDEFNVFDFSSIYKVSDNFDDDLKVDISSEIEINDVGTYDVVFSCVDSSGNKSIETLVLDITGNPEDEGEYDEEEVKEETKVENTTIQPSGTNADNIGSDSSTSSGNASSSNTEQSIVVPVSIEYLFSNGYDMQSASNICFEELSKLKNGSCLPIQDENGIYLGMKLEGNK